LGNIFININSAGPPPVWSRSQNAQKYLVLDWASQPTLSTEQPQTPVAEVSRPVEPSARFDSVTASSLDTNDTHSITETFLDLYYKRSGSENGATKSLQQGSECGGWRYLLPGWSGQSAILDIAIRALAACFVGTQHQDEALLAQASNTYLHALQMVQQVLSEPDSVHRKDLLAATLVMSSTELFMSNGGGESQLAHIEGATRLLLCAFETQDFDEVHVHVLNQGLLDGIANRRRYAFSAPFYRPLVRQLYSAVPTRRNQLYFQWCESILPLPNILSAADNGVAAASSSSMRPASAAILTILDDLAALEQTLATWYETVKDNVAGPWTYPAAQINAESVLFPMQFLSIEACTLYCLYWTSQLLVLDARRSLLYCFAPGELSDLPPVNISSRISEYASLICRSVQFCTHETSFAATENMFFPLYVVSMYYARQGDEERTKWCQSVFVRIAEEQKIGYAVEALADLTRNF
jgi:hypothetical protein